MKNKKVLIIGGCGYIGSYLFDLLKDKYEVTTVDLENFGNFSNPKNIKMNFCKLNSKFINSHDVIIFLAGRSSVPLCENIMTTFNDNVVDFFKLIKKIKNKKFIYASSSCVYVSYTENLKTEKDFLKPNDGLTLSKTVLDYLMELTNIEFYGLRFGSVNGWSKNTRLDLMINSMTFSGLKNKKLSVLNGQSHRPILSISDLGRSVEKIIESENDNRGIYNVASFNTTIFDAATSVSEYLNCELINNDLSLARKGGNYDFCISSEKFCKTFNFTFQDNMNSIISSLVSNPYNDQWSKR